MTREVNDWQPRVVANWSGTEQSPCYSARVTDAQSIAQSLCAARAQGLTAIVHAAGHSYTDAALNTGGLVVDVTGLRRILSWDAQRGVVQVEPGVTIGELVRVSLRDGWWPAISPSTADATIGGCVAMNVTGKNAWRAGSFGAQVRSLTLLLASGDSLIVSPDADSELFHAVVGSAGLLGVITSVTLQLRRVPSPSVAVRQIPTASLSDTLARIEQEPDADFLEAWLDGFAGGAHLGRGFITRTTHCDTGDGAAPSRTQRITARLQGPLLRGAGRGARYALDGSIRTANRAAYHWINRGDRDAVRHLSLFDSTYYSADAYAAFRNLLPSGIETFHAFVPRDAAYVVFRELLSRSQANRFIPIWCIVKRHRSDPFLLSYQVDGFSLELNYARNPRTLPALRRLLRELMEMVIGAGGRLYLAKDSLLTAALYRRSLGDDAIDAFLSLKRELDPGMLFQSNLYRRIFEMGELPCPH
jgi:decaprenylphospho-beta-D-ribofuranose 2-oxidase